MKKFILNTIVITSFIGCGTSNSNKNNDNIDNYMSNMPSVQTNSKYNPSKIQVSISDNNKNIHMNIKDIGNWGSYYVGATSSDDNFTDNPIEAATLYKDFMVDCTKNNETNQSIYYYCVRTLDYNGYYYTDETGIGDLLKIYKNIPTYLYLKPVVGNKAYIVGEFSYKNKKVIYSPYKKVKVKNLLNNNTAD